MGNGVSQHKLFAEDASSCLDEDVFGVITSGFPKTSVPIEIKPKRRLQGNRRQISLRGDSVNKSSSIFSNLSSYKNSSLKSFLSLNKSEYKVENARLKAELDELKYQMSMEMQGLIHSKLALESQNDRLKGEIRLMKCSQKKMQKELIAALDSQLKIKETAEIAKHRCSELQNSLIVHNKFSTSSYNLNLRRNQERKFTDILNTNIISSFFEFMITLRGSYGTSSFSETLQIRKQNFAVYYCSDDIQTAVFDIISEISSTFSLVICHYIFNNIVFISTDRDTVYSQCEENNINFIIMVEKQSCHCMDDLHFNPKIAVHHIKISGSRKMNNNKFFSLDTLQNKTNYNVTYGNLSSDIQSVVFHILKMDNSQLCPLVYDYAMYFSLVPQYAHYYHGNEEELGIELDELNLYLKTIKQSLFVSLPYHLKAGLSCYIQEQALFQIVCHCRVTVHTSFHDFSKMIYTSMFHQIGVDLKYINLTENCLFDVLSYLGNFYSILILIDMNVGDSVVIDKFQDEILECPTKVVYLSTSRPSRAIQRCDSVYLIDVPDTSASYGSVEEFVSKVEAELRPKIQSCLELLDVFESGLCDRCLCDLLKCDWVEYLVIKQCLVTNHVISTSTGLISINYNTMIQISSVTDETMIQNCLEHLNNCRCYHLHLEDISCLLSKTKNFDVARTVLESPEVLAYYLYNHSGIKLIRALTLVIPISKLVYMLTKIYDSCVYTDIEKVLIYRIIAQIFYCADLFEESLLFMNKGDDLSIYAKVEQDLLTSVCKSKLYVNICKPVLAEEILSLLYRQSDKGSNEGVQILLIHNGMLRSLNRNIEANKLSDLARETFFSKSEAVDLRMCIKYCALLHQCKRYDQVETMFRITLSRLTSSTDSDLLCQILTSYASFRLSSADYPGVISLLEYLNNSEYLVESSKSKVLRMLGLCYFKTKKYQQSATVYKTLIGLNVNPSAESMQDLFNFAMALVKVKYYGSAYNILTKMINEHCAMLHPKLNHDVLKLLQYLRKIISSCKPSSGRQRLFGKITNEA